MIKNNLPAPLRPMFTSSFGGATLCVYFDADTARRAYELMAAAGARVRELELVKYGNSSFILA